MSNTIASKILDPGQNFRQMIWRSGQNAYPNRFSISREGEMLVSLERARQFFGFFIPLQGNGSERNPTDVTARRASYLELQKATYKAAKAADANVTVLSGGFAMGGDYDRGFLPWLMTNGLMDYCDVLEIHTYWSVKNLEDVLGHAQELMRKVGANRPIWVTEFGIALKDANDPPSIGMVEHHHVANMAPKALATALALGVERFYWYQGYTEASAPVPSDHSEYSLSVTDGPTPAFWTFSTAARLLRNAWYIGRLDFNSARNGKRLHF